ncbi:tRNA lysidine(34) synthetase TilS [Roseovarius sp. 2305UL8-3]|uniref:tRNA lysidine(34) synthetase TilS n=1 Tax=Roseovarius conchicola TaxID=3121636 RepID=UPI003528FACC
MGVAVSGGGDSVALLVLLADWGRADLRVATVDHGLRAEAADEARQVAALCADLGIPHDILRWSGWDGQGNLPDQARRARYALMADWATSHDLNDIVLGHTSDDQAETFLMRLARAAGLDGLSAMAAVRDVSGVRFHRPLLGVTRELLRDFLRGRNICWAEDPSNEDNTFERVRIRKLLADLGPHGITGTGLAQVADQLREARDALNGYVLQDARRIVGFYHGDLLIDNDGVHSVTPEALRRVVKTGLIWVSGADYPPRGEALERLLSAIRSGQDMTLGGCRVLARPEGVRITREWKAVAEMRVPVGTLWDGRWQFEGPVQDGLEIAALGEAGLAHCPDRKATGRPAASLMASPALWEGPRVISAPLAGLKNGWQARLMRGPEAFFSRLAGNSV